MISRSALLVAVASGAAVEPVHHFHGSECDFSRLSGINCYYYIRAQDNWGIRNRWLKLDFTTSTQSFIFTSKACPYGLVGCISDEADTDLPTMHMGLVVIDPSIFGFQAVSVSDPGFLLDDGGFKNRVLRARDVHGSVAFGPNSPIYQRGRGLAVSEIDEWDVVPRKSVELRFFSDVTKESDGHDSFFVPLRDPQIREDWGVLGELQVNGGPITDSLYPIRIDPGADEVIIPSLFKKKFIANMQGVEVKANGRLGVKCSKTYAPRLSLIFGDEVLKIKRIQLLTSDINYKWCPLRIVFSATATSITVGRALVRSLTKVMLDAGNKQVGFTRRSARDKKLGPIVDKILRVPSLLFRPLDIFRKEEKLSLGLMDLWHGTAYTLLNPEFKTDSQVKGAKCVYMVNPLRQELTLAASGGVRYEIARGKGRVEFSTVHPVTSGLGIEQAFYTFNRADENLNEPVSFWVEVYDYSHIKICQESIPDDQEITARESPISLVSEQDEGKTDNESDASTDVGRPDSVSTEKSGSESVSTDKSN